MATRSKTLRRVIHHATPQARRINYLEAENNRLKLENKALSEQLGLSMPNPTMYVNPSNDYWKELCRIVSQVTGIEAQTIKSQTRKGEIVAIRCIMVSIWRTTTNEPLKSIGGRLSGRDHSSIIHAIENHRDGVYKTFQGFGDADQYIREYWEDFVSTGCSPKVTRFSTVQLPAKCERF